MLPLDNARLTEATNSEIQLQIRAQKRSSSFLHFHIFTLVFSSPLLHMLPSGNCHAKPGPPLFALFLPLSFSPPHFYICYRLIMPGQPRPQTSKSNYISREQNHEKNIACSPHFYICYRLIMPGQPWSQTLKPDNK